MERGTNRPKDFFFFLKKQEKIIPTNFGRGVTDPIDGGGGDATDGETGTVREGNAGEYEEKEAARCTQATPATSGDQKTALPCRQSLIRFD